MEGADIADIYYPAFLTNGKTSREYPEFRPGQRVRLRIINAAASSQFWLTFGGEEPLLTAADGLDVVPVVRPETFIAVAETYDFIVTIPQSGKMEIRATVQDGSGQTSAFLGQGEVIPASDVPRPDKIAMMQQMAKMEMRMGAPAIKFNPSNEEPYEMLKDWGMQMEEAMEMPDMEGMDHTEKDMPKDGESPEEMNHEPMDHQMHDMEKEEMKDMDMDEERNMPEEATPSEEEDRIKMDQPQGTKQEEEEMKMGAGHNMEGMELFSEYNYNYLKAPEPTSLPEDKPVREVLLNLTGNMVRYIWSMNGMPVNETDKIEIKQGEVVRLKLNNLTMMHHPMHLHGHFFRVINEHGEYSPLKSYR